ncbi:MAG: hypothetical protein P0116_09730 [Candidatus Nitrosocosmicus sp.]|nr:hypothetical protein [Candidatus Nitrosocosmicus sp.]
MQDNKPIGITFVSENFSNSIDSFWMIIKPEILINPFDFISVENVQNTKTIGMIKELKRIYIDRETLSKNYYSTQINLLLNTDEKLRGGLTVAKIDVIANHQLISFKEDISSNISGPKKKPSKSKNGISICPFKRANLLLLLL